MAQAELGFCESFVLGGGIRNTRMFRKLNWSSLKNVGVWPSVHVWEGKEFMYCWPPSQPNPNCSGLFQSLTTMTRSCNTGKHWWLSYHHNQPTAVINKRNVLYKLSHLKKSFIWAPRAISHCLKEKLQVSFVS